MRALVKGLLLLFKFVVWYAPSLVFECLVVALYPIAFLTPFLTRGRLTYSEPSEMFLVCTSAEESKQCLREIEAEGIIA